MSRVAGLSSCDDLTRRLFCSVFLSFPVLSLRRAGVWSRYFQIATARSYAVKRTFVHLSGSFKDSHEIAFKLPGVSPRSSKRRGDASSLRASRILFFFKYKKKANRKVATLPSTVRWKANIDYGRDLFILEINFVSS
jgi:hypothetical protein